MAPASEIEVTLLPGARALLGAHAREVPQRDDLCGAFCGLLALRAAAIDELDGEPLDQDALALAAGSVVSRLPDTDSLPRGEQGRRDYRLALPLVDDPRLCGTTAGGLVDAIEQASGGRLAALPYAGPWTPETLRRLFDVVAGLPRPVTMVANLGTRYLWGGRPRVDQLLAYLLEGEQTGPPPDWDVGHFACVIGRAEGPGGRLYLVADTYPSLGSGGVHLQPEECLASALERPEMAPGGMIAVVCAEDAEDVRARASELGLSERTWDNGTVTQATLG